VDQFDYSIMNACMLGPDNDSGSGCECFDFDADSDNDLFDFAKFQTIFTGS